MMPLSPICETRNAAAVNALAPDVASPATPPFACRVCGSVGSGALNLSPVLDLGRTPLANQLLRPEQLNQPEPTYPLRLVFCDRCSLLQITETVPPEVLFRDYLYFSSFSDTVLCHCQRHAERLITERRIGPDNLVVEAASNDGYQLQFFRRRGIPVLGIEPAWNVAAVAKERGIDTIAEFFSADLAAELRAAGTAADVFLAKNVLAHVADLNDFVRGISLLLAPNGVAEIEVPYVKDMIDHVEFDTIYHEHLCYFSLTALDHLFRRHGLILTAVERIAIHGGSLRVQAARLGAAQPTPEVAQLLGEEQACGLDRLPYYEGFAHRVVTLKDSLSALLAHLKGRGKRLAAYGAAAKGSTLLNYVGIGTDLLDFVVDRSIYKQGRCLPGVRVPIRPPVALLQEMPDYVLLLAWNFAPEILEQQAEYRRRGGQFIIPVPQPVIC